MQSETFHSRDEFLTAMRGRLTSEQWQQHGDTITQIAAPVPIDPIMRVFLVLLFSIVGMGGSYWVAWYGIRVNTYANCPHGLRLASRRAVGRGQHPAARGHVDRVCS